jgi:hypothetical protein
MLPMPSGAQEKHVFVSYVRENSDQVDKLCAVLAAEFANASGSPINS